MNELLLAAAVGRAAPACGAAAVMRTDDGIISSHNNNNYSGDNVAVRRRGAPDQEPDASTQMSLDPPLAARLSGVFPAPAA